MTDGSVPEAPGYENLVVLSSGGSGVVYSADDTRHGRRVAIKVLVTQSLDPTIRESFEREIRAMGRLSDHPHIVAVYDSGFTADNSPFLVMPLYEHGSYADRVSAIGRLGWNETASVAINVLSALETSHHHGVLHRDIKPANLFVGQYQTHALLGDFGISTFLNTNKATTKAVAYTLLYAAPEVLDGNRQTRRSDIYSLGATLHEFLLGEPTFASDTTSGTLKNILMGEPETLPAEVPPEISKLIRQMMAKEPDDRPASCLEVAERFQQIQRQYGSDVTSIVISRPATSDPSTTNIDRLASTTSLASEPVPLTPEPNQQQVPVNVDPTDPADQPTVTGQPGHPAQPSTNGDPINQPVFGGNPPGSKPPTQTSNRRPLLFSAVAAVILLALIGGTLLVLTRDRSPQLADTTPTTNAVDDSNDDSDAPDEPDDDSLVEGRRNVEQTNFDAVYRRLDSVRGDSIRDHDPATLESATFNKQVIADVEAQAAQNLPPIDKSANTFSIEEVTVFDVIDENNVMLRVVDSSDGVVVQRDAAGVVLWERSREEPRSTFIVWLQRRADEPWKAGADYEVPNQFPQTQSDLTIQETTTFESVEVEFATQLTNEGVCVTLKASRAGTTISCNNDPSWGTKDGSQVTVSYIVDVYDRFETVFALSSEPNTWEITLDALPAEPLDQGPNESAFLLVDDVGSYNQYTLDSSTSDYSAPSTNITELRNNQQAYHRGLSATPTQ